MKKTKLIFGIIVTVVIMMIIIPTVFATEEERGVIFENRQCGENAYATLYENGELIISGKGDVNSNCWGNYVITKLVVCDGITGLTNYYGNLFEYSSIRIVQFPATLETIYNNCFRWCYNIEIVIYDGTEEQWERINKGTGNSYLENANIHFSSHKVTDMEKTEATCSMLGFASGKYCEECDWWFSGHEVIAVHPDNNDDELCDICGKYKEIIFENEQFEENKYATLYADGELVISGEGIVETFSGNSFPWSKHISEIQKLIISEGITELSGEFYNLFSNCEKLTEVSFPQSLVVINYCTFLGCTSLTSVVLPDTLSIIGYQAFADCTNLVSVTMPSNLTKIESCAFQNCYMLKDITIPDSVTYIGNQAFAGCGHIEEINIPAGVECIGEGLFTDCIRLKKIVVENPNTTIKWSRETIPEQAVIWGYEGSTAETYANYWQREFRVIGGEDVGGSEDGNDGENSGEEKPHEHKFPEVWLVLSNATCTQNGISIRICEGCNEIQSQNNYAYGHNDEDGDGKCDECSVVVSVPEITDTPENPEKPDKESKGSVWDIFVNFFAQIRVFIDSIIAIFKF